MMAPFDGSGVPGQQPQGVAPAPMSRPPMPPGHQGAPSPGMHQQPMNAPYMHRQSSVGMVPNGQYGQMPGQSPSHHNNNFGMPNQAPQGQYSSHPPLHSPAHQQQPGGMHPNMAQMSRNGSGGGAMSMGMPMQPHDQMMNTSQGHNQNYMGNSMGGSMNNSMGGMSNSMNGGMGNMSTSMNGGMGMNSMRNPMNNVMGNSMNSSMNSMSNSMNNAMNPSMNSQMNSGSMNMGSSMNRPPMNSVGMSNNNSSSSGNNSGGLNGNWQSERDTPHRREMIQHIVKMLKKDKNGSPEWLDKLPQMAKQLEVSLYRNARSFAAYTNMETLKKRLQQIAVEVSRKARIQGDSDRRSGHSSSGSNTYGNMNMSSSGRGQIVNPSDINPMANNNSGMQAMSGSSSGMSGNMNSFSQRASSATSQNAGLANASASGLSNTSQNRNDPEWKIRIRHKQQRLLLLHHSAKCPHEDGRCTVTPHCADMKKLWKHMEGCKDNQCRVAHCFSSRAILSHYRKCRDTACPACGPVRETVRKTHSRNPANASARTGGSSASGSSTVRAANTTSSSRTGLSPSQQRAMMSSSMNPPGPGGSFSNNPIGQFPGNQNSSGMAAPNGSSSYNQGSNAQSQHFSSQRSATGSQQPNVYNNSAGGNMDAIANSRGGNASSSSAHAASGGRGGRSDSEWQKVRHRQQRLLLLRHASRCKHTQNCPVTPHCASMKKLWNHIAVCKDQKCTVAHCISSRFVLAHFRRCRDAKCPACAPVRDTIRKSQEGKPNGSKGGPADTSSFDMGGPPLMSSGNIGDSTSSPNMQPRTKRHKSDMAPPSGDPMGRVSMPSQSGFCQPVNSSAVAPSSVKSKDEGKSQQKNEDRSLLDGFTVEQLTTHLESLNRASQLPPAKLKQKCSEVLKSLEQHQHCWVFNSPVDPVELGLPDYFEVIKKPMDLGIVRKKLDNGTYHAITDFAADVNLTFDNAMTYNEPGTVVFGMAQELKDKFEIDFKHLTKQLDKEDEERRQNDKACMLCGCEKRLFEPPVFFCNGMNCASKRIRRNSHFYIAGNNQYFWCNQCFNDLDGNIPIELIDLTIQKDDLKKKKNDEIHEESWVQCDSCNRWIHQICGLFNTRQNKEHHSEYCCPICLLDKRKNYPVDPPPKPPGAVDLPRTKLSEFLENHVDARIQLRRQKMAREQVAADPSISMEDALTEAAAEGGAVTIRQVTSMDRKLDVRENMRKRYEHKKYPDEFPFRCKCLVVFQHIDGVDVVLFALYVYEHGVDNPAPNKRCVYISYLDSVHFMRPRQMRTFVYHEILIAYLDSVRQRGYATAHIWACPPLKGDDYIFYAKPEDQRTPKDARLRQWYIDMLVQCQQRNIVGKVTNMYDLYFANESLDATVVPYLEGDYFPGEAENIIKVLEEGSSKKGGGKGKKKKGGQSKSKNRGGTRSTGVDEEALLASGIMDGAKTLDDLDRDQVMVKLGEIIQPMKESFLVAFLNWAEVKKEDLEVPEDIITYRKENPEELVPLKTESNGTKRDAEGNSKESSKIDKEGRPVKIIDDDVEDLDCEFLNNRQAFLNLCRGNHYQFDELRRAKHTSMMVLWHLHNRDAPKFVQQCVHCNREILSGKRYHCPSCPDYDLCETCYNDPNTNRGACTHNLQAIAVESSDQEGGPTNGLTEAQRKQRQRNLLLHIQLIEHASQCTSPTCKSSNCVKMKNYLQHAKTCQTKVQGGCRICKRIWTLLRIHAQKCKETNCTIPQCKGIREKMRELQKQQQAMDDRRRMEMNRHYRMNMAGSAG